MTGISSYSTTASENVQANTGIDWDETMSPADVDNSARQNMADLRAAFDDLVWFAYGAGSKLVAHAYASANSTTIAGNDLTAIYHAGRRVRAAGASTGTIYGAIAASAYAGGTTTVSYIWDSGALVSEPLVIALSQIPVTGNPVAPTAIAATPVVQNYLTGLTLSTAGGSASFAVAPGQAADSGNAVMMTLASALTKTTAAWTVGTNNGALDTGTIANATWYHAWLIRRPDTGVVDILCSLSATTPTLPSGYTQKRRIGAMLTDGSGHWVAFTQIGDNFLWATGFDDVAGVAPSVGAGSLYALTVPPGISAMARCTGAWNQGSVNGNITIASPFQTGNSAGVLGNTSVNNTGGNADFMTDNITNLSQQIKITDVSGTAGCSLYVATYGWIDVRGRNG